MIKSIFISNLIFSLFLIISCSRGQLSSKDDLFRASDAPAIHDAWGEESLVHSLRQGINFLYKNPSANMKFGELSCTQDTYAKKLTELLKVIESKQDWKTFLQDNFNWLETYGSNDWGEVLVTGYFEPIINGSEVQNDKFTYPLLPAPEEMKKIDLKNFINILPAKISEAVQNEERTNLKVLVSPTEKEILPFPDRSGINQIPFKNWRKQPIAWVDPVDAFFLQIQGSGTIKLPNKEIRVGYAEQNGYPYTPIGKFLGDKIKPEDMSMQSLEQYVRGLSSKDQDEILNKNQSYVFMKEINENAITYSGLPALAGRTIATDKSLFPKGALAYLKVTRGENKMLSQLVFDHDTGGAIKGPGRVDLFTGKGAYAKDLAGPLKNKGFLYYLMPKACAD